MIIKSDSEAERLAIDFMHDFERQTGKTLQTVNADDPDGIQLSELYEVVDYPAIIATADDGSLLKVWQGRALPSINEVSYYTQG